jgi:hypothetical protein
MKARTASTQFGELIQVFCFCSATPYPRRIHAHRHGAPSKLLVRRDCVDHDVGSQSPRRRSKIEHHIRRIELAKPNYRHAKKQKEAARKARQDAKQQRRSNVPEVPAEPLPLKPGEF